MRIEVLPNDDSVAREGAAFIAAQARAAVASRGQFTLAVSGGRTPWLMLRDLTKEDVPWHAVHVLQVDERIAPAGDPDRNLMHLTENLLKHIPLRPDQVHPMPVELPDPTEAAARYSQLLWDVVGAPLELDLVHLGMGPDGHTASLIPGDPVLEMLDKPVGVTGFYQGRRRMTLTYPVINRARCILWIVTGAEKAQPLARMVSGDQTLPAGRVSQDAAVLLADRDAAALIDFR